MSITIRDRHGTYTKARRANGPKLDRKTSTYFAIVHNVWSKGYKTRGEAETAEANMKAQARDGVDLAGGRTTFGQFVEQAWWPNVEAKLDRDELKPSTVSWYRLQLDVYILPAIGDVALRKLQPADLRRLYRDLRRDRGLAPKTIRNVHSLVSNVLALAMSDGYLGRNVAKSKDVAPRGDSAEMRTWTSEQTTQFLDSVRDDRLYAAWRLLATTGMRRGELLGLKWSDLDLDARTVNIERAIVISSDRTVHWSTPKTEAGRRVVDLDDETIAALRQHHIHQNEERLASMGAWPEGDDPATGLLFTDEVGRAIRPPAFSYMFSRLTDAAEVPAIRLHDVRHTCATLLLEAGVPVHVVAQRLGHKRPEITLSTYAHVLDRQRSDAADKIAAVLSG